MLHSRAARPFGGGTHIFEARDPACNRRSKRRYGVKSALDYLIREKLLHFADAAEKRPEFARELPRFLARI